MSTCAACGSTNVATELCPHHHIVEDFAVCNRIYCNGLHRGVWPARLPQADREDTSLDMGD